jgi:hypothetical protein
VTWIIIVMAKSHSPPKFYVGPIFVFSKHRKYLDFHQTITIDRIYLIVYTHRSQLIYAWCDNIMWHGLSSSWQNHIHLRSSMLDQYSYFRNIANIWTSIRLSLLIEYIWLYTHIEVNWFMHDAIISCEMDNLDNQFIVVAKWYSPPKFYAGPIFVFSKYHKWLDFHQTITIDRIYLIVYTHRSQLIYAWCDNIMWHG